MAKHPTLKKQKKCGNCGRKGHNTRSCTLRKDSPDGDVERRARIRAILERTKAGCIELAARAAGADLRELAAYPHVYCPLGKKLKAPGMRRVGLAWAREDVDHHAPDAAPARAPIAPPIADDLATLDGVKLRRDYRCNYCSRKGHNARNCTEIKTAIAAKSALARPSAAP